MVGCKYGVVEQQASFVM